MKHSIEKIKRVLQCLSSQYQTKTDYSSQSITVKIKLSEYGFRQSGCRARFLNRAQI